MAATIIRQPKLSLPALSQSRNDGPGR